MNGFRDEIDKIDAEILALFIKRMEISKKIGIYKAQHGMQITDFQREDMIKQRLTSLAPEELKQYTEKFIDCILALSKDCQISVKGAK